MSTETFERQLHRLLERGYTAMPLPEAVARGPLGTADAPPKSFTLTFDDGFESLRALGVPALKRLGLSNASAAFVPTAYVGGDNAWREEPTIWQRIRRRADIPAQLMTWDDLAGLASEGIEIGSHGARHLPMNELTYEQALEEAVSSREALSARGFSSRFLAWPYGWHTPECKRAVRDGGFDAAFSVTRGGADEYEIRRIPIYGTDDPATSALKLSGRYFDVFERAARLAGRRRTPK